MQWSIKKITVGKCYWSVSDIKNNAWWHNLHLQQVLASLDLNSLFVKIKKVVFFRKYFFLRNTLYTHFRTYVTDKLPMLIFVRYSWRCVSDLQLPLLFSLFFLSCLTYAFLFEFKIGYCRRTSPKWPSLMSITRHACYDESLERCVGERRLLEEKVEKLNSCFKKFSRVYFFMRNTYIFLEKICNDCQSEYHFSLHNFLFRLRISSFFEGLFPLLFFTRSASILVLYSIWVLITYQFYF